MCGVMKEVSRLYSMKQLVTTPYHPICNGLVERFNGTLTTMLKRMCVLRSPRTGIDIYRHCCLHIVKYLRSL